MTYEKLNNYVSQFVLIFLSALMMLSIVSIFIFRIKEANKQVVYPMELHEFLYDYNSRRLQFEIPQIPPEFKITRYTERGQFYLESESGKNTRGILRKELRSLM